MYSPMIGCIGINPFYGPYMSPDFGILLGLASATAAQTNKSSNFGSSLYTSPYTSNTARKEITMPASNNAVRTTTAYNTGATGSFGSLTTPMDSLFNGIGYMSYGQTEIPSANPYASLIRPTVTYNNDDISKLAMNLASGTISAIQNLDFSKPAITSQITSTQNSSAQSYTEKTQLTEVNDGSRPQGMTLSGKGVGTKYGPAFLEKVKQISQRLNCNYRDLLAIFNSEFGIEANKTAKNGAVGLICFMPQFFDTRSIVKMSPLEQLDVVEQTIMKSKKSAGFAPDAPLSKGDLYALVFLPGRAGNEVLCKKGERGKNGKLLSYYESNSALDYNHDGVITKSEMAHRIDTKYVSDQTFLA